MALHCRVAAAADNTGLVSTPPCRACLPTPASPPAWPLFCLLQARRRWRLMLKVLPDHKDHEFPDLVGQLVDKYLPALRERGAAGAATPARGAREEGQLLGEEAEEEGDE